MKKKISLRIRMHLNVSAREENTRKQKVKECKREESRVEISSKQRLEN